MKIGILGSGVVGQTLGTKLASLGHSVKMGSRTPANAEASAWAKKTGEGASHGTFADAAHHGEMLFNCTLGEASLEALRSAKASDLVGKILVDVSNALDFSKGMPPALLLPSTDSLAEQIQRAFPEARVVKALNTVAAPLMVDPGRLQKGAHSIFICGNDPTAKKAVQELLEVGFGWKDVVDLGDVSMARGTEAYLLLWTRLYMKFQNPEFNIRIVR
ncbi:MAG TPA: NAD(P)-binding domain-containing protein [Thermoplasmata archaeon]|nr:NAD(P)-binding domain-containing protein [Thermoplasmata archaeon]